MIWSTPLRRISPLLNLLQFSKRTLHASQIPRGAQGVRWLQPAGAGAKQMESFHRMGAFHYTICMGVLTAEPLRTEDLQRALVHLYNKIQTLRTCFRYRDGELWICEMERRKIDFQEVSGDNLIEEVTALLNCTYTHNEDGPLWRARLMRGQITPTHECHPGFPHQSTLLISFHHGISDGNVVAYIFVALFKILEEVIGGASVDDEEQVGCIASDEQTLSLKNEIREYLEEHPDEVEKFAERNLQSEFTPLLYKAFGFPEDPQPTTRYLMSSLESPTLWKFYEKCKGAGVTFNSGFILAVNTALVELAREAGVEVGDAVGIRSRQTLNLRRYWGKEKTVSFGCHIGRIVQTIDTPQYNKDTFWDHARKLDADMREKVRSKHVLKEEVVREMKHVQETALRGDAPVPIDCDYAISNTFVPGTFDAWRTTGMSGEACSHPSLRWSSRPT
ncbi:uncharacterized protein [Macrobrachium rosenbergii]|uniref:uncharacterized protein isoform X1 n=1 Tax=Macrobrachium rosenbergii TaxID=79674 RepID=UPI0034D61851